MLNQFYDKYIFTGGLKYTHNNFSLMGIPFAMVPVQLLLFEKLADDKEFTKKVYYSVKDSMVKSFKSEFGIDFKLEGTQGLLLAEQFFSASGWGLVSQNDLDREKKHAIMIVNNSPFALHLVGKSKGPADHLLRGVFAGLFSVFFEKKVDCVETECMALNAQRCKFVIKENHDFDFKNPLVRQQIDAQE